MGLNRSYKKLKNGKIQVRYIFEGVKKTVSFDTKKEAAQFFQDIQMRRFTRHLSSRISISKGLDRYRDVKGLDQLKRGDSRKLCYERLEDHLLNDPSCRLMYLDEIKRSHLLVLREKLLKIPLAPTSTNLYMRMYRAFFQYCVELEWLQVNPAANIRGLAISDKKRKLWTPEQQRVFIESFSGWMREMLYFFRYTGIRPTSITRLTWADLNVQSLTMRAVSFKSRGGAKVITEHHLIPELIDFLRDKHSRDSANGFGKQDHFIFHSNGQQLSAMGFCQFAAQRIQSFRKIDESFNDLTIYAFRHSFVSEIGNKHGVSIASKVIGHKSVITTEKFYFKENDAVLINAVDQSFKSGSVGFGEFGNKAKVLKLFRDAK